MKETKKSTSLAEGAYAESLSEPFEKAERIGATSNSGLLLQSRIAESETTCETIPNTGS